MSFRREVELEGIKYSFSYQENRKRLEYGYGNLISSLNEKNCETKNDENI